MGRRPPADIEEGPHKSRPPMPPPPQYLFPPAPKTWFAWLVPLIFLADTGLFVYTMYLDNCPSKNEPNNCFLYEYLGRFSFEPLKSNPLLGPDVSTLRDLGALDPKLVRQGQAWRLLSCIWLHAGLIHLVANMLSLLFIGIRLEQEFGFLKIGVLFVLSGFGGSLMSCLSLKGRGATISVGASGALFGLLGAMLSELITNWTIYENKCAAFSTLLVVIALNLGFGLLPNVDNSAHIGGFISGFLLGFILLLRPQYGYVSSKYIPPGYNVRQKKSKHKCYQYLLLVAALVVLIIGFAWGLRAVLVGQTISNIPQKNFY